MSSKEKDMFAWQSVPIPVLGPTPAQTKGTKRPASILRQGSILSNSFSNGHEHKAAVQKKVILTPPPSPKLATRQSTTFSISSSDTSSHTMPKRGSQGKAIKRQRSRLSNASASIFDKNDRRYRCYACCCGGRLHIRHGALVIGVVECLIAIGNMIAAVCLDAEYGQRAQPIGGVQTEAYLIISVVCMALFVATVGWMAYASARRKTVKRSYLHLIPHLVVQMLTILLMGLALLIIAILAFRSKKPHVVVDVFVLAFLGIGLGVEVFFFALVMRCYHYLKDEYELSARPMPTCVVLPMSGTKASNLPSFTVVYQPNQTYWNVAPYECCVY